MLMKKLLLFAISAFALLSMARSQTISGHVTDANGNPLGGVSVHVKNTRHGTTTGPDGNFQLPAEAHSVLIVTNIGYNSLEISADADLSNLVLQIAQRSLEEVI